MDESWRISIGSVVPRRRSTEEQTSLRRQEPLADSALDREDFRDVFGGPPRSVLLRRFSGDLASAFATDERRPTSSFYDEVFRPEAAECAQGLPPAPGGEGRRLLKFRIPAPERRCLVKTEVGFYNDIFRSDNGSSGGVRWSRSRSKSTRSKSSSMMSLEDASPPVCASETAEDAAVSSLASKLRPITIPSRRRTSSQPSTISVEEEDSQRTLSMKPYPPQQQYYSCLRLMGSKVDSNGGRSSRSDQTSSELRQQRSHAGIGLSCCFLPPETMSLEASFRSESLSFCNSDDGGSSSSVVSSVFRDPSASNVDAEVEKVVVEIEREEEEEEEEGDQEIASSYVIKIGNRDRAGEEAAAAGVDEAIAWAKEKFWSHQMAMDINDEEIYHSSEATDGFRGHCIHLGED